MKRAKYQRNNQNKDRNQRSKRASAVFFSIRQLKYMLFSLLPSETDFSKPVLIPADDRVDAFIAALDTGKLSGLKVAKISIPNPAVMNSAQHLEEARQIARTYGAEDSTERVVLYQFGGTWYAGGFLLQKFSKNYLGRG